VEAAGRVSLDLGAVRAALAQQIAEHTGLRAFDAARGSVSPPACVVLPGPVAVTYGKTMDGSGGAAEVSLRVMLVLSDAAPDEKVQRFLDSLIGVGSGEPMSVPDSVAADPTLSGTVSWAVVVSAGSVGHLSWASQDYFGCVLTVSVGA
jgi:hypothetical protein